MSDDTQVEGGVADKLKREAIEFVRFLLGVAAVFLVITTLVFRTFYIPSGSMEPTLQVGDRVLVLNFIYGWSRHSLQFGAGGLLPEGEGRILGRMPQRGDVIVFRHPERREHLIKRVIGLPGDEVQMIAGRLYINGEVVPRDLRDQERYRNYQGLDISASLYEETLPNGRRHAIYEHSDREAHDDTIVFTVPENHVFVMGDNRDSSQDSRVVNELGYVPVENIVGRAVTVLFTLHRCRPEAGMTCPRTWDRMWRGL